MMNRETKAGAFETFKSNWLLQVAADKEAKAAAPVAIVLCCKNLNRGSGQAWPSVAALKKMTGASSENTIRNALKILEARGHAHIVWTKGGSKNTNRVTPLVAGEPFKKLKGSDDVELQGSDAANPAISGEKTLQLSAVEPFKKLKGNHLIEPSEEPLEGDGALYAPVANSIVIDSSNTRETNETDHRSASSSGLDGRTDASVDDDLLHQCGIAGDDPDYSAAPVVDLVVTDEDADRMSWSPDVVANFLGDHDEPTLDELAVASNEIKPDDPFGDLDDHTPLPVPPADQIDEVARKIVGSVRLEPALLRELRRLLRDGSLTRARARKILSLGTMEGRNARSA